MKKDKILDWKIYKFSLDEMLEICIGMKGTAKYMSKSCGPPLAIYNSNVFIENKRIYYGDLDLEVWRRMLCRLAEFLEKEIRVYGETIGRWEELSEKNKDAYAWSTKEPDKIWKKDWYEMLCQQTKRREENLKARRTVSYLDPATKRWNYALYTPFDTNWHWYNIGFYKTYLKIRRFYNVIKGEIDYRFYKYKLKKQAKKRDK